MNEEFGTQLQEKLKAVYFTLLKMGANKQDAEDILQETAYQFIKYIDGIDANYAEAWLYRVAINKFYDALRKKKHANNYVLTFNLQDLLDEQTPESYVLQKEAQTTIQQTLSMLQPKEMELLILKYSAELTLNEIAILFQTTDKSIKTQLARARKKFSEVFERTGDYGKNINY
ncbi:RNA polymerase sigma factor [Lysinibacillus pakistanensis]|uniref:Sigma-70 family RNA polymerase sigma factor n=1 Tax=Lysinibacillus pakistanensis TaxID=759811 RepID=A0AAX3X022_9BACI|nr:sigma-70 family RNA polymerase sigma factor [Lysinibacillus pakistanensis]MDM5233040.1 sigma-70 family RNA polymerase sigma factor [Lysinibacillus pakistanensis]WHY48530.1 sigma-70 family RNA polymerase sigma factor [Lysinibacillus pakistanensis]WHY53543.1 sigma-70 family RNA polymerase sigma factor [Lysinibacillus pakistanensis]